MIESNLAKSGDYEWVEKIIKKGYKIILYFLCTDDINIHIKRVQQRVIEGGHDVAIEIIRHRYQVSITYLKSKLHLFKEIYFIDNTTDEPIIVAELKNRILHEFFVNNPKWVSAVLSLYKKINR